MEEAKVNLPTLAKQPHRAHKVAAVLVVSTRPAGIRAPSLDAQADRPEPLVVVLANVGGKLSPER